jgi:hypothetical protein
MHQNEPKLARLVEIREELTKTDGSSDPYYSKKVAVLNAQIEAKEAEAKQAKAKAEAEAKQEKK